MKIALDCQIFAGQRYGGISRYFSRLSKELIKMGEEVKIIAPIHQNAYVSELPDGVITGYNLIKFPPKTGKVFSLINQGLSSFLLRKWQPDVIHETYYSRFGSGNKKTPHVITVYDMIHERFPESFHPLDKTCRDKKIAVQRADIVIAISENTRKDLLELYSLNPNKVVTIHLGFDTFEESSSVNSKELLSVKKPFLLYVGNRSGYKNFSRFVQAYAASSLLKNNFSVIAFGGGDFTSSELRLFNILKIDIDQMIHLNGGDSLLGSLYRQASAFIYPSLYEGFGIPPLEAMAHDCIVIASNVSSIPEVVGEAASYFDPDDVENIREILEKTLGSQQIINDLKIKGRHRLTQFSWEKCAEHTFKIYQNFK